VRASDIRTPREGGGIDCYGIRTSPPAPTARVVAAEWRALGRASNRPHYVEVVDVQESDGDYTLTLTTGSRPKTTAEGSPTVSSVEDDYGEQPYGENTFGGIDA